MQVLGVTDTNLVALKSKRSAVDLGYMADRFIHYFVPATPRKEVVLNKGYWCRYYCIYTLLKRFLRDFKGPVQIVSLGCGLDTTPFNLFVDFAAEGRTDFAIFESDLEQVVTEKVSVIRHHPHFLGFVEKDLGSTVGKKEVHGGRYGLFPLDLNEPASLKGVFQAAKVDPK